jgi:serine/threonine protein phosphatase 1
LTLFEPKPLVYAIGDIHGCLSELKQMHEFIDRHIKPEDIIVYIGDYIDRGPDSKGVVDLLIERQKTISNPQVHLLGNHEDMMMEGNYWMVNGGAEAIKSYGLDPYDHGIESRFFQDLCPRDHQEFYAELRYHVLIGKTVFVHAAIDPSYDLDNQADHTKLWVRHFDAYKGDYVGGYTVVRGHTPTTEVIERTNQIMIDTGCVFGNKLTCLIIDPNNPEDRSFHQVKSEQPKW